MNDVDADSVNRDNALSKAKKTQKRDSKLENKQERDSKLKTAEA